MLKICWLSCFCGHSVDRYISHNRYPLAHKFYMHGITSITSLLILLRPHIEYANSVWSPFKLTDIKAVAKVQMRATKLHIGVKSLPYCERLRKLKLPTLKYRC